MSDLARFVAAMRIAAAALAVAVALFLLLRVSLLASFRAALVLLAALEVLQFGRRALAKDTGAALYVELAVKLVILAIAYVAVGGL